MADHCAVTIPLEKIRRIQIYVNTARKSLAAIKKETGADYILNGTLYNMKTFHPNCHLKVDGEVLACPDYTVEGYAWNQGPDISMDTLPDGRALNYIACTPLIVSGTPVAKLTYDPGQGGRRGRSAIGIKAGRLALYCTRDGSSASRTPEKLRDDLAAAGWESAVMLDGGGSSQCDFPNGTVESERIVATYLLFWEKKNRTKEETNIGNFKKKVCLDAGHDASNTANASPDGTYLEHEFALDMAKRIKSVLESAGVQVVETRPDSDAVSLEERRRISNKASPDLFVSLHSNAAVGTGWNSARGWECYVYGLSGKRYEAAKAILARVEGVAPAIRKEAILERPELYVLKHTIAPAVLIEHGFHTNKEDVAWMKNDAYRQRLAQAEGYGILDYLCVPIPMEKTESELAVEWITGNGIMKGGESGDLMLEKPMTRKEFAVMMWRYKNKSEHGTF